MKRYRYEPTVNKLNKVFEHSVEVPKGYKTHAQHLCRRLLGRSYYCWAPLWQTRWIHGQRYVGYSDGPWAINEDAAWQYRDGRLYFKDPANMGIVTMAMLSKPKKIGWHFG